ncbi:HNH endonuclease [Actinomyces sp. Z3]|nr:HNH endonuclease [Actinomyces sp. Z3]
MLEVVREPTALIEHLAEVPAGAGLASLVEGLLAGILVPANPNGEAAGSAGENAANASAVATASIADAANTTDTASTADAANTADAVGIAELAEILGTPDTGALFNTITSPADRALAQASAQQGVDWGEGTGIDRLATLGGQVLSELVAACHRLVSWASWCESAAAACLARTPEMNRGAAPWGPDGRLECLVTEEERRFTTSGEIACRLGTTRQSACQMLDRGEALLQPEFAATETLHRGGLLDASKTALIVRRLEGADARVARAVQEQVLPRASRRTTSQLAKDIDRALAALDPDGAGSRRKRNLARRHVTRPRQAGEGVHEMRLLLPSLDAFLLDATLDAIAASARAAGDERSPAQLRADAITGMTLRTLQASQYAACRPSFTAPANVDHAAPATVPTSVDAGAPPPAPASAQLLPDGVPLEGLLAGLSSLVEPSLPWWTPSGVEAVFPPPGITINVDVAVPLEHLLPDGAGAIGDDPQTGYGPPIGDDPPTGYGPPTAGDTPGRPTDAVVGRSFASDGRSVPETPPADGSSAPTTGHSDSPTRGGSSAPTTGHSDSPTRGGSSAHTAVLDRQRPLPYTGTAAGAGPAAEVTIGVSTAPVPAATARALAAGGVWRRLVTDPVSGTVVDVGRTHYRPPVALRELVQARDGSCTFPGCTIPATRCDTDHIQPWAEGGATSLSSLTSLCQAHHRLKHTPGWSLSRTDSGDLTWCTPTGARYRRSLDGSITLLAHRIGPRQLLVPAQKVPARLTEAVDDAVLSRLQHGLELSARDAARADGRPRVASRGPRPGQPVGAFETTPYSEALHDLGLAPLLDEIPPF